MSRRGNPYDNPKAESFFKTLKVEEVYRADYATLRGRRRQPAPLHRGGLQRQTPALRPGLPEPQPVRGPIRPRPGQNRRLKLSNERGALQMVRSARPFLRPRPVRVRKRIRSTRSASDVRSRAVERRLVGVAELEHEARLGAVLHQRGRESAAAAEKQPALRPGPFLVDEAESARPRPARTRARRSRRRSARARAGRESTARSRTAARRG